MTWTGSHRAARNTVRPAGPNTPAARAPAGPDAPNTPAEPKPVACARAKAAAVLAEAWRGARAARSFSVLFLVLSLGPAFAIALLAVQAQGQRDAVVEEFSQPDMRTVALVVKENTSNLPWSMAESATALGSVQEAWVLGKAFEVWNEALPDRGRVSARAVDRFADLPIELDSGRLPAGPGEALLPAASAGVLGLDETGGALAGPGGAQWTVVGTYVPQHSRAPSTALVAQTGSTPAAALYVTVDRGASPAATARIVLSLLGPTDRGGIAIDMADGSEDLGRRVTSTVSGYAHTIVVTMLLVAVAVMGFVAALMVHSRRQEFGRRRALGASRTIIVWLVVLQSGMVIAAGSVSGLVLGACVGLVRLGSPPDVRFLLAVEITVLCGSVLAQLPAALAAGWRDPVRVLRTP